MAFHKNLVEKDLHAPSRFKVKNIDNIISPMTPGTILANRAAVIHGQDDGLLSVIPVTTASHTGLYAIVETELAPGAEAYATTFGVLRDVPVPMGVGRTDHIAIDINSTTGELLLEDDTNDDHRRVAISLSARSAAGTATILVIGGVPSSGSSGGGSAPSAIEEFKGFFDPNTRTYPTDNVPSSDEVREGDYFIVDTVLTARTFTTLEGTDTAADDIFGDVIIGDVIYSMIDDINGPFNFDNFYINRTITELEREILQDLKPADGGEAGQILIVRDPDPTDPLMVEKDYELRQPFLNDIDLQNDLIIPKVSESAGDRILVASIPPTPGDPGTEVNTIDVVNHINDKINDLTTEDITDGNEGTAPGEVPAPDRRYISADERSGIIDQIDDLLNDEIGSVPVRRMTLANAPTDGVVFDRLLVTEIDLAVDIDLGSTNEPNRSVPRVGGTLGGVILETKNYIDSLVTDDVPDQRPGANPTDPPIISVNNRYVTTTEKETVVERLPDLTTAGDPNRVIIQKDIDGLLDLTLEQLDADDISIDNIDEQNLEDRALARINVTDVIDDILKGRVEFRGEYDPVVDDFPSEVTDVNSDYIIRGWFWIVTGTESLGVSPTLDLVEGQLLFADPSTTDARKTGSLLDPISATDFFAAGGTSTGGGGGTGDSPFEGRFVSPDGPPDFDVADIGDYWIVTDDTAGDNFPAITEDLSVGDLVIKIMDNVIPAVGDYAVFFAAANVTTTFLGLTDVDDPNALVPGDGYASYPDSFPPNTTNIVTTADLMAPVINGVDESLAFASIYTFNQGGSDLSNGTYTRTLALDHTDTDTDFTFATDVPWDSTIYKVRNNASSTSFLVEVSDVVGITHINGYPLSSQIDLSPIGGGSSTARDAVLLAEITAFTLEAQGDSVIVSLANMTPPPSNVVSKDYTDSDFEGTNATPSLGMFNIVTTTGSNESKSFQIILNEPVTRTAITSGTGVRLTGLTLTITRESGSTTNVPTVADYDTNVITWPVPDITFGSATLERVSGTNRVSQANSNLYSFLSQFDNIDVLANYNTPIDFTNLVVTNGTIPNTTPLPSFIDAATPVRVITARGQSVDVLLNSADIITEATATLPAFRLEATFTYDDSELNNPQFPSLPDTQSISTSTVRYGYDVWYGTVAEFDSNGNATDFSAITINDITALTQPANFSFTPLTVLENNTVTGLTALRSLSVTYPVINESVYRILIIRRNLVDGHSLVWESDNGPFIISNNRLASISITDTLGTPQEFGIYLVALTSAAITTNNFEVDGV